MLLQLQEYIRSFLKVEVEMGQDQSPEAKCVAVLHFLVTNTAPAHEYHPEIVYEEVLLKIGAPPNWHVERFENLAAGQSISYDHPCTGREITRLEWAVEGRISPAALLHFSRRPVSITGIQQLSVKAYFDYLANMNVFQRLEGILKNLCAPEPDMTLCEMKAEESSLKDIADEITNSAEGIQDLLEFVDLSKYSNDIVKHKNLVRRYLKETEREVADLMQIMRAQKVDGFDKARDKILDKLTSRADKLDKATSALVKKVGVPVFACTLSSRSLPQNSDCHP
ncbi:hypothetical protein ACFLW2_04415 [Chloroflexota bacterium]